MSELSPEAEARDMELATTRDGLEPAEPLPTEPLPTEPLPTEPNPFTPDGTGTVVDNATDQDGKEFFTITTAEEAVFYLVIDRQRETENVYFLNAVTVADLVALAMVVIGGGAGWYFKIYRPKLQKAAELEEDYGGDPYDGPKDYDGEAPLG